MFAAASTSLPPSRPLPVIDTRARGAVFYEHSVASIINPPEATGMGFWSINPYVGCEFGCSYCYARYAHRYVVERAKANGRLGLAVTDGSPGPAGGAFERRIFVKQREAVLQALERDLSRVRRRSAARDGALLLIGTSTDPYQPAERRFHITRVILERIARERGLSISIITKSPLVCRDSALLADIERHNRLTVHVSLISTDAKLIRLFETRSPMPHVRLRALRKLTRAGINAGLIVAPILPGITDTVPQLAALLAAAQRAGARFAHAGPLRLYASVREHFLPLIDLHYPDLAPKYRRVYRGLGNAPSAYAKALSRRFRRLARERGVTVDFPTADFRRATAGATPPQLPLWSAG